MTERYHYKATKLMVRQQAPRIIRELRITNMGRQGEATIEELDGAADILYRLFCDESIRLIAKRLHKRPAAVFDALDSVLSLPAGELAEAGKGGT